MDGGTPILIPVLENHRFDEAALARYLDGRLPGVGAGLTVRQFQGGQSNPTFHLQADRAYVLRKKPKGTLLVGAHAIEREYRVQLALAGSGLPVPQMHLLCIDTSVIGEAFYVMSHVPGRIFTDRLLGSCEPAERHAIYQAMNTMLADLHAVNVAAVGLQDFGKPDNYIARQVTFWIRNYASCKVEEMMAMDKLSAWVAANIPPGQELSLVHGDFRLGNLVIHPTKPEIVAILDWELATLGHPLSDLAYNCLPWHLPSSTQRGFADQDFTTLGIPTEADYLLQYRARSGRGDLPDWEFFVIFAIFRIAAIVASVYKRALDGNASDAGALNAREVFRSLAEAGWALACLRG